MLVRDPFLQPLETGKFREIIKGMRRLERCHDENAGTLFLNARAVSGSLTTTTTEMEPAQVRRCRIALVGCDPVAGDLALSGAQGKFVGADEPP